MTMTFLAMLPSHLAMILTAAHVKSQPAPLLVWTIRETAPPSPSPLPREGEGRVRGGQNARRALVIQSPYFLPARHAERPRAGLFFLISLSWPRGLPDVATELWHDGARRKYPHARKRPHRESAVPRGDGLAGRAPGGPGAPRLRLHDLSGPGSGQGLHGPERPAGVGAGTYPGRRPSGPAG